MKKNPVEKCAAEESASLREEIAQEEEDNNVVTAHITTFLRESLVLSLVSSTFYKRVSFGIWLRNLIYLLKEMLRCHHMINVEGLRRKSWRKILNEINYSFLRLITQRITQ
ncbi:PREDICTED: uncharacterized protein LOC106742690 [Dinoponera quadriceps]|uniref:Uncharacterized protein LOC106742690 n=1 Tax=Dinoponera quadriceps TaxID=609295 RepID=A0A6P3WZ76_DINQU|nr:PREDICTED: uncharacterized protein LOC106742690 [Dinoponera quadriceps]